METARDQFGRPYTPPSNAVEIEMIPSAKADGVQKIAFSSSDKDGAPRSVVDSAVSKVDETKDTKETEKPPVKEMVPFLSLFRFADKWDIIYMTFGSVCAVANGAVMPLFSIIFGDLLDSLSSSQEEVLNKVEHVAFIFAMVGICALFVSYAEVAFWMMTGERQAIRYREEYFKAIIRQEVGWYDTQKTGELTSALSSDIIEIQDAMGEKVGNTIHHFFTFLFGFIVGFIQGWQLTLVIISVAPLLALCGGIWTSIFGELAKRSQAAYAGAGGIAEEIISCVRTVASFTGEKKEIEKYDNRLSETEIIGIKKGIYTGISMGLTMLILFGSYSLTFWYGAELIIHGVNSPRTGKPMTGGDVVTVFFSVLMGAMAIGQGTPNLSIIGNGRVAAKKVHDLIDRIPLIDSSSPAGLKDPITRGNVSLSGVKFRYPSRPDIQIFDGLDITISSGQKVALVGSTGSGKSSVVALLERFYDPEAGLITIDGVNIKDYNIKWLRQHIGLVSQEPILFVGSIKENILNGRLDATEEEVINAAKIANAHDFVSRLPEGYNTQVGERGVQLSGGQKQRIAIARAILKNPPILLLDEATSALDTESEALVQTALEKAMAHRTTIIIAHRLSTVRDCDNIIVLNRGSIVESGRHEELMALHGNYYNLVLRQTKGSDGEHEKGTYSPTAARKESFKKAKEEVTIAKDATTEDKKKEDDTERDASAVPLMRIFEMIKNDLGWAVFGVLNAAANGCVMPVYSLTFTQMVRAFYETTDHKIREGAKLWAIVFISLGIASLLFETFRGTSFGIVTERLTRKLRRMSFASILNQDIGYFDMPAHTTGKLATKLASDATLVSGNVMRIQMTVQNMVTIAAGLAIAFYSGWKLTLVILSISPVIVVAGYLQMDFVGGFAKEATKAFEGAGEIISQSISGVRTVSSFTLEERMFQEYQRRLADPLRSGVKKSHYSGMGFGVSQGVMFFSYSLSFWYGSILIHKGEMEFEDVMRAMFAIVFSTMASGQISSTLPDLAKTKIATREIFKIIDTKSRVESMSPDGLRPSSVAGNIDFHNVNFSYPTRPDIPIFTDVNISVPAGKTVALVGSSGSGKSSVISLLERFYLPHSGTITLDGVDISKVNTEWLRGRLGLVSQEPVLFACSIKENIAYGVTSATDAQIEEAARIANAYEFIARLPEGFNTYVGERGTQLSGGQKQRIAIARAVLKNPPVLLLDEATSALDTESEAIVQAALERAMQNRTTIVIAHRLSTVRNADKIIVLHQGRVVEQGRHEELLALGGYYTQLVHRQTAVH